MISPTVAVYVMDLIISIIIFIDLYWLLLSMLSSLWLVAL